MSKLTKKLIIESRKYGTFEVLYDAEDEDKINKHNWHVLRAVGKQHNCFYVITNVPHPDGGICTNGWRKNTTLELQRLIMDTPKGMYTDHINGDPLDNRKQNLRTCTHAENMRNRGAQKDNTSGFKGVCWRKSNKTWYAQLGYNKKKIYIGCFKDKEEAAKAYDRKAIELFGEFAWLNFPIEDYQ